MFADIHLLDCIRDSGLEAESAHQAAQGMEPEANGPRS